MLPPSQFSHASHIALLWFARCVLPVLPLVLLAVFHPMRCSLLAHLGLPHPLRFFNLAYRIFRLSSSNCFWGWLSPVPPDLLVTALPPGHRLTVYPGRFYLLGPTIALASKVRDPFVEPRSLTARMGYPCRSALVLAVLCVCR